jgi:hypothetical protein
MPHVIQGMRPTALIEKLLAAGAERDRVDRITALLISKWDMEATGYHFSDAVGWHKLAREHASPEDARLVGMALEPETA